MRMPHLVPRRGTDPFLAPFRRFVGGLVLLPFVPWITGCQHAPPGAPEEGPEPTETARVEVERDVFGFDAPEILDEPGFRRISALRLPIAASGYALRYGGEERPVVDVYLYPVTPDGQELSDPMRQARVEEEFSQALQDIHTMGGPEQFSVDDSEEPDMMVVEGPEGSMELLRRRVVLEYEDGRTADSHLLVGSAGPVLMKVRSTFPSDGASGMQPHLEAFLEEFTSALSVAGHRGMADYDHDAARILPVPDDLPESFPFRLPRRLRSGWELQGTQRLPGDAGTTALYRSRTTPAPIQVFLRPWSPPPGETPDASAGRMEARWATELEEWTSQFAARLEGQGFTPLGEGPEELDPFELSTHYGTVRAFRARRSFRHEEGMVGVAHLAVTAVEEVLLVAAFFIGVTDEEVGDALFVGFVEDIGANLLATRPPPGS